MEFSIQKEPMKGAVKASIFTSAAKIAKPNDQIVQLPT